MADKKTKKDTAEEKPAKVAEKTLKGTEKVAKVPKKESKTAKPAEKEVKIQIPTRLAEFYKKEITPSLMKKFNYKSIMQGPRRRASRQVSSSAFLACASNGMSEGTSPAAGGSVAAAVRRIVSGTTP